MCHSQERIGVEMTLWPTGVQEEKKRMKSRLATSIRSSFLYMNLRGRIPVSTLLAAIVMAAAWARTAPDVTSPEAPKGSQTRVAPDKETLGKSPAPGFYCPNPD